MGFKCKMGPEERIGTTPSVPFHPGWDLFKEEAPGGGQWRSGTLPFGS